MNLNLLLPLAALSLFCAGCNHADNHADREDDVLFIGYRFSKDGNAYACANTTKFMGDGYSASFNASPHVKIWGSMCSLTWVETANDGSRKTKHVTFPVSNIYEIVWKSDQDNPA